MTEVAYGELRGHAAMPCVWDCCTIRRVANEGAFDLTFDAAIIEKGLSLTVIGVSTAFALLLILSAGIWAVGRFFGPREVSADAADSSSAERRDKALAAAIAVSALREIRDNSATLPAPSSGD